MVAEQLRRPVPGGIGTYARGLLQGLAELGQADPTVTLFASRPPSGGDPLAQFGLPILASRLPGPLLTRAWDRGRCPSPSGFDLVHAVSLAAPPVKRRPLTVFVHDLAWREVPDAFPPRGRRWHEAALRRATSHADVIITAAKATARALQAAGANRVEVVEHGADHLPPADHQATAGLLRSIGVSGPYLLAVGTLEPRKNLARLLAAYEQIRLLLPEPWPLVVVGPYGWGAKIRPGPGVVQTGRVADAVLAGLYSGARCVAYVPLLEGFGLPAVEAMAACTPLVASPMPSTGAAGLEVDPTDTDAIAAALMRAATDDTERSRLVTAGLLRTDELTWAASARHHLDIWRSVG